MKLENVDALLSFNGELYGNGDLASLNTLLIIAIVIGTLTLGIALFEIINVVSAAVKASKGEEFTYPLSINFIKETKEEKEDTDLPIDEVLDPK